MMNKEEQRQAVHSAIEAGEITIDGVLSYASYIMGKRSAMKLTPEQRKERGKKANQARWNKND